MKIKQKTKSSATKRFIATASGKLKRKHAYRNHMAIGSTTKQKRQHRKGTLVSKPDAKRLAQCL